MQFSARFNTVEARGAKLDGDGERIYVLFGKAGAAAVVAADAFEALYEPKDPIQIPAPPQAETPLPFKFKKAAKAIRKKAVDELAPANIREHVSSGEHPLQGAPAKLILLQGAPAKLILAALAKRPMSSSELSSATGLMGSPLYSTCNNLKTRGSIESFVDDAGDGTRRYRLPVAQGKAG